jgi:pimeloyl-ACP methyl ester carboxylesterase
MCYVQTKDFASVNGTRLYYEITGEGEALILLHSGYTDLRLWDNQYELFGKYFKVIRYDIRGFGKSDRPRKPFSNFEDLKELLSHLGIQKAHLIGVSMGGSIAIDFTLQYPEMVERLILSGPSLNGFKPTIDDASQLRSLAGMSIVMRDDNFNQSVEYMLNNPMWRQANPMARQQLKNMFMETSLDWLLDDTVQIYNIQAVERLSEINKRTLLIIGSEDSQPIKEIARVLESNISMIQVVTINDTGHLPNLDKPEIFNKYILDFLLNTN